MASFRNRQNINIFVKEGCHFTVSAFQFIYTHLYLSQEPKLKIKKMKTLLKNPFLTTMAIAMMLLSFYGCEKEEQAVAPELPPESAFVIDFSDFNDETKNLLLDDTYQNRNLAVLHIALWNTIIAVHLAVPVATYREALNHEPVEQEDGSWLWSYDVQVGLATYTADLYGKSVGVNIEWEMFVSKSGPGAFNDFLWYSGESHMAGTEGNWTLYKSPAEPVQYVDIVWNNNLDGTFDITYTNIVPGGTENGGYISYGVTKEIPYNAFYEIYNKGQDNLVEINWNRLSRAGQIKDPNFYNDDDFHCWNELGVDIDCP
jgi:hypothetical protein